MEDSVGQREATTILIADSMGSVIGAVVGGFYLVPQLGIQISFALVAVLQALALTLCLFPARERKRLAAGALTLALAGVLMGAAHVSGLGQADHVMKVDGFPLSEPKPQGAKLLYEQRSPYGVLSVVDENEGRNLRIDNRYLCRIEDAEDVKKKSQWFVGDTVSKLALLGEGAPSHPRLAIVGLGCGTTLAAALSNLPASGPSEIDVIDINPEIEAAQVWFRDRLPFGTDDPRARMVIEDGFVHFTASPDQRLYDGVMIDVVWMQNMNTTHIFSAEMFANVKSWLTPRGVLAIWSEEINPYSPIALTMYNTLKEVFPLVKVVTSQDALLFFAGNADKAELRKALGQDQRQDFWIEDAASGYPVNRLDNLALNRYRFTVLGDHVRENIRERYRELTGGEGAESGWK
jgi:spermidine synthase